jgi:tetratricopeptide (TPR) repeat protein
VRQWSAWLGLLFLTLYLVFVGGGWFGIYVAPLRQISVGLAGLVLAAWVVVAVRVPRWRPRSAFLPAIAVCLVSLAISTVLSRDPRISVEYLGYAVLLGALYLLLVRLLADPFLRARFGAAAVVLCLVIAGLYVVLVVGHWSTWWTNVGHLTVPPLRPDTESLTWGNPSAVLTMAVLFLGAAIGHVGTETAQRRAVAIGLTVLVGIAALLTGSRAGWFGLGVAIVLVGGAWLLAGPGRAWLSSGIDLLRRRPVTRWFIVAAAALALVAGLALAPAILRRAGSGGEELRVGYVLAALRMFTDAPLAGTGPGTWVVQRIRYTVAPETDYYIPHAHDIYAQTLAELGALGAAAGVVLLASLVWLLWRAVTSSDAQRRRWGWLAAFTVVYFGAHQLLDFYANMPAVLFAAALPIAWLDATNDETPRLGIRRAPVRLGRLAAIAGLLLVVVSAAALELTEIPAETHASAVALANSGEWTAADAPARAATAMDPSLPPYRFTEGLVAARLGDHARAVDAFARVVAVDDLPEGWLDLAAERFALGDRAGALTAIDAAMRLGYQRPAVAMAAGDLALRAGDRSRADAAFAAALVAAPSLAGDAWWNADAARAAVFTDARRTAIEAGPEIGWEIALVSGDPVGARRLADQLDAATAARNEAIIAAWSGDRAAMAQVVAFCEAHPLDVDSVLWCARVEGHSGDQDAGNRYRARANTIAGNAYLQGAELRVNPSAQVGRSDAGNPAVFYGYYTYRRPTPWDMLVPSLVHLTLE